MKAKFLKEFFSIPDIIIMIVIFLGALGYTFPYLLSWETWLALIIGMGTYAVSEYIIHRFVFHIDTPKNPFLLKLIKRLHYDHHVDPTDLSLLFLPVWFSLPNFAILSAVFYLITGSFQLMIAFLTGVILYFLFYEWKHYIAHKPIQPLTAMGKKVKKAHLWHHFKNENYWFGVSHTTIDKTMGTYKDQKNVEKSATAKNLEKRR